VTRPPNVSVLLPKECIEFRNSRVFQDGFRFAHVDELTEFLNPFYQESVEDLMEMLNASTSHVDTVVENVNRSLEELRRSPSPDGPEVVLKTPPSKKSTGFLNSLPRIEFKIVRIEV